jgi:hypothetical protein
MASGVLNLAADVHDRLLKVVAPASPGSIEASSLAPTRNPVLFFICLCAVASFLIFVIPVVGSAFSKDFLGKDLCDLSHIIGGAGLGSSFYALHTASRYIKSGTFDQKYNNTYLLRFGLGLLSGLILACFLQDFLQLNSGSTSSPNVNKISVSALALIGGYSAEAVERILRRISDTLVAFISGSDKDKIEAVKQRAHADAERKMAQGLSDAVRELQLALSDPNPQTVVTKVHKVVADILDRK